MNSMIDTCCRDIICKGRYVVIGRPRHHEFALITGLRNRPDVREWFIDNRLLDAEANSRWLEEQRPGPKGALYSIRYIPTDEFLGTVGWSWLDPVTRRGDFGRFAIDKDVAHRLSHCLPKDYPGFAYDTGVAFLRFLFLEIGIEEVMSESMSDNVRSQRIQEKCGLIVCGWDIRVRPDGTEIVMKKMSITREHWLRLQESCTMQSTTIKPHVQRQETR